MFNLSQLFRLNLRDLIKGLVVAVLAAVVGAVHAALTACGIDLSCYDWSGILQLGYSAGIAYLAKNFFSDEQGKVLGKIG